MIKFLKIVNSYRFKILNSFKNTSKQVQWRLDNSHNFTVLEPHVKNPNLIKVGNHSYGEINVQSFENPNEKLIIGDFVSIAGNVVFILGGNHQIKTFTTYPIKAQFYSQFSSDDASTNGSINVEDEVWIGTNVTVMSGVTIGKGSIVAAGSIVTKDVKPFSIVGGNPAKFLKYRIDETLIDERLKISLIAFDFKNFSNEDLDFFYQKLDFDNLQKIKKLSKS